VLALQNELSAVSEVMDRWETDSHKQEMWRSALVCGIRCEWEWEE
jgi:hypothetical protein